MSRYLRSQVTRFIVLFVERAGSTYVMSCLDSHPEVHALREQFAVLRQQGEDADGQLQWAWEFWTPPLIGEHAAIGFKTKLVDVLDREGFAALLHDKQVKVIRLNRRNAVKGVISTINARRLHEVSGNWNLLKEADRMSPFAVDLDEFQRLLQAREDWDSELEAFVGGLQLPTLPLYYEELLEDEGAFLSKVFAFLNVPERPVQGKTLKHTADDLRQAITNFDELRARYAGTRYEAMFDEVLV